MDIPKGPSVLDQWEAEAAPLALLNDFNALRLMAIIDLVRKKDEALKAMAEDEKFLDGRFNLGAISKSIIESYRKESREALTLTSELK